jgi:hypothetical protein
LKISWSTTPAFSHSFIGLAKSGLVAIFSRSAA